jgi:integral membrane sensor domain MASE1
MKELKFSEKSLIFILRYIAHLFSVLLLFVVFLFVIGEGFPSSTKFTTEEVLLTLSFIIMLIGLLSAWKWELFGGLLIILGFATFFIVNSIFSKNINLGFIFYLFPLTGFLYLFCCLRERNLENPE